MPRRALALWTAVLVPFCVPLVLAACARSVPSEPGPGGSAAPASRPPRPPTARILEAYGRLPLHFEENHGQADPSTRFIARADGGPVRLTHDGLVLGVDGGAVRLTFVDAAVAPRMRALDPLPGRVNHYRGADPSRWRTGIPTYARVRYEAVYPGIDVVVYGNQRRLEYDFVVAPGADPRAIRVRVDGADAIALSDGALTIRRGAQTIVQQAPVVYQERDGARARVPARYELRHGREIAVAVGTYDHRRPLVIDPVVVYSTRIGGGVARGIAVDASGFVYLTGENGGSTFGSDYPLVNPAFSHRPNGFTDIFVTKLTPGGDALVFSTFIGSQGPDTVAGVAVDSAGNAWIGGYAGGLLGVGGACDFPTTSDAVMPAFCRGTDSSAGVVAKLSPTGSLLYATYLGGTSTGMESLPGGACIQTLIHGIAVDASDDAYVAGMTQTVDFPTTAGAYQPARAAGSAGAYCHGDTAGFVTKLTARGKLSYSTYLDAVDRSDAATAVAVDTVGRAYVGGVGTAVPGRTSAPPFAVTATLTASGSQAGGYVVKLDAYGFPAHATVIGPTPESIDVGPDGTAYAAGAATADFVAVNGFQASPSGEDDGFAARLNAAGTGYVWSTYVGGSADDVMTGIAAGADGSAWLVGSSASSDFPTKDATRPKTAAPEAVVVELAATGALLFGTAVGGGEGAAIAVDPAGNAYVTGAATADFPTTAGAYRTTPTGTQNDVFVVKYAAGGGAAESVIWTSPVRVAVAGNAITKNAGCDGCADAGAISQQTIASGDGFVEFTVSPNAYLTVGLSTGNPGTTQGEIRFGLRFFPGSPGYVEVRESGVYKADWKTVAGAVFRVAVEGGVVKYFQGGVLKYTSAQAPAYPLLLDASVLTPGAGVQHAMIGTASGGGAGSNGGGGGPQNVVWASAVNVAVSGNTITKNAGCDGCGDAGAVSQQTIASGNASVSFAVAAGTHGTIGLSTGNAGTGGSEIRFGLRFFPGSPGYVEVRESGVYKSDFAIVPGAVYTVAVDGGAVKYFQNGTLKYTSAAAPSYPLLVDTSLYSVASAVQNAVLGR